MAEEIAGQSNAQSNEQQQQVEQQGGQQAGGEQKETPKERVYSQAEVDRIATKVRRNTARDTEISLRRQLNATDSSQQQQREAEPPKPKVEEPPKQNDGESWEEFVERKAEYAGRKAAREERETANREESERKTVEQRKATERTFKERSQEILKADPVLAEKIESADDVPVSTAMGEVIQASPIGVRILGYLVDHPDESARISEMSARDAAHAIGKIEARIEAALEQAKASKKEGDGDDDGDGGAGKDGDGDGNDGAQRQNDQQQQRRGDGTFKAKKPAPDPIEPGSARSANANAAPSDKDDMATWVAKRNAEEAAKRRRRK